MILNLKMSDGSKLFVHQQDDGSFRVENYTGSDDRSKCIWGHTLTEAQMVELKEFVEAKATP